MPASVQQATPLDKPYFPISVRLLRVVSVLIQKYHSLLITECEIFLSLIVKFLDPDKPMWQRSLALEVLHKLVVQPELLNAFCECYDLKTHTTNIFQDIVNSLGAYVQSLFVNPQLMGQSSISGSNSTNAQGQPPALLAGMPVGPGVSPQPGFFSRGVWLPVIITFPSGQAKSTYLEMMDKVEPPTIPDGYGISVAYACLLDIIRSISMLVNSVEGSPGSSDNNDNRLNTQLINSSWCGLLAALSPLIDARIRRSPGGGHVWAVGRVTPEPPSWPVERCREMQCALVIVVMESPIVDHIGLTPGNTFFESKEHFLVKGRVHSASLRYELLRTMPRESKNTSMVLTLEFNMRAFLGSGDEFMCHSALCFILSGSYSKHHVSSPVIVLSKVSFCSSLSNTSREC
ncbi:Endocytosis and vacuole integrity protein [Homalodisca vitripennis]|nr:Endocytosis and vacuole integrity protein [Homalodisca vitripennis]